MAPAYSPPTSRAAVVPLLLSVLAASGGRAAGAPQEEGSSGGSSAVGSSGDAAVREDSSSDGAPTGSGSAGIVGGNSSSSGDESSDWPGSSDNGSGSAGSSSDGSGSVSLRIWALGPHVRRQPWHLLATACVTLFIVIFIEQCLHLFEHWTWDIRMAVEKIYKELMILGILSFILLLLEQTNAAVFDVLTFEFVHFVLFVMAIFFAGGIAFTIRHVHTQLKELCLMWNLEARALGYRVKVPEPVVFEGIKRDYYLLALAFRRDSELVIAEDLVETNEASEVLENYHNALEAVRRSSAAPVAATAAVLGMLCDTLVKVQMLQSNAQLMARKAQVGQRIMHTQIYNEKLLRRYYTKLQTWQRRHATLQRRLSVVLGELESREMSNPVNYPRALQSAAVQAAAAEYVRPIAPVYRALSQAIAESCQSGSMRGELEGSRMKRSRTSGHEGKRASMSMPSRSMTDCSNVSKASHNDPHEQVSFNAVHRDWEARAEEFTLAVVEDALRKLRSEEEDLQQGRCVRVGGPGRFHSFGTHHYATFKLDPRRPCDQHAAVEHAADTGSQVWTTEEHWYQAQKYNYPGGEVRMRQIRECVLPSDCQTVGDDPGASSLTAGLPCRPDLDAVAVEIVEPGVHPRCVHLVDALDCMNGIRDCRFEQLSVEEGVRALSVIGEHASADAAKEVVTQRLRAIRNFGGIIVTYDNIWPTTPPSAAATQADFPAVFGVVTVDYEKNILVLSSVREPLLQTDADLWRGNPAAHITVKVNLPPLASIPNESPAGHGHDQPDSSRRALFAQLRLLCLRANVRFEEPGNTSPHGSSPGSRSPTSRSVRIIAPEDVLGATLQFARRRSSAGSQLTEPVAGSGLGATQPQQPRQSPRPEPNSRLLEVKAHIQMHSIRAKFMQNPPLAALLTSLRSVVGGEHPVIEFVDTSSTAGHYWGIGGDRSGRNMRGCLLSTMRDELLADTERRDMWLCPQLVSIHKLEDDTGTPWGAPRIYLEELGDASIQNMSIIQCAAHPGLRKPRQREIRETYHALHEQERETTGRTAIYRPNFMEYFHSCLVHVLVETLEIRWQAWFMLLVMALLSIVWFEFIDDGPWAPLQWVAAGYVLLILSCLYVIRLRVYYVFYLDAMLVDAEFDTQFWAPKEGRLGAAKNVSFSTQEPPLRPLMRWLAKVFLAPKFDGDAAKAKRKSKGLPLIPKYILPKYSKGFFRCEHLSLQLMCLMTCAHASITLMAFSFRFHILYGGAMWSTLLNVAAFTPVIIIYGKLLPWAVHYYAALTSLGPQVQKSAQRLADITDDFHQKLDRKEKQVKREHARLRFLEAEDMRKHRLVLRAHFDDDVDFLMNGAGADSIMDSSPANLLGNLGKSGIAPPARQSLVPTTWDMFGRPQRGALTAKIGGPVRRLSVSDRARTGDFEFPGRSETTPVLRQSPRRAAGRSRTPLGKAERVSPGRGSPEPSLKHFTPDSGGKMLTPHGTPRALSPKQQRYLPPAAEESEIPGGHVNGNPTERPLANTSLSMVARQVSLPLSTTDSFPFSPQQRTTSSSISPHHRTPTTT